MNAAYRASLRSCFHKHLNYDTQKYKHPDLNPSRIKKDEGAVQKILEIISTTFIDPLSPQPLLSISNGVLATDKVSKDTLSAKAIGKTAMDEFIRDRLSKKQITCLFDPIKKKKLGTFTSMNKVKKCKVNSKIIPLQATKDLFARISLVAQKRSLNMRDVFEFPLGPLPWSLAESLGSLKKTSKASLLHKLEGNVEPLESLNGHHALIVDGMAYVQQSKVDNKTFGDFAKDLLTRILVVGKKSSRIDVVFDEYRELSIKNVERSRRSSGSHLLFQSIVSTSKIKQWGMFLSSNDNKNALVKFIASEWKEPENLAVIGSKSLFVTDGVKAFNIKDETVMEIPELESNHEEADTRMLLHAQHASQQHRKIMISSPDTDVFVICLSFKSNIIADLYFLTGVKNSRRIIDISAVVGSIDKNLNICQSPKETLLKALIGSHCFTGCDTVSAFAGRGKVKPLMLMMKRQEYVDMFASFGTETNIDDFLMGMLIKYVCHMYSWEGNDLVNDVRYRMYCQSGGKISCEKLPPCEDVLRLHIRRANYQAYIWRQSLASQQHQADPLENGWCLDDEPMDELQSCPR